MQRRPPSSPPGEHDLLPLLGGVALVVGPVTFLVGMLLRLLPRLTDPEVIAPYADDVTYYRQELALFETYPSLLTVGYGLTMLGTVLLVGAVIELTRQTRRRAPLAAVAGGTLAVLGLLPRLYHHGVEVFAWELLRDQGFAAAAGLVGDAYVPLSYGPLRVAVLFSGARLIGWPLLAWAAWRGRVVGVAGGLVLATFGLHRQGVLKGSSVLWTTVLAALCVVLVPIGIRTLRGRR